MAYDIEMDMEQGEPAVRVTDRDGGVTVLQFKPRGSSSYVRFHTPDGECPYRRLTHYLLRDFFLIQAGAAPQCLSCRICMQPVTGTNRVTKNTIRYLSNSDSG